MYKKAKKIKQQKGQETVPLKKLVRAKALISRGCKREARTSLACLIEEFPNSVAVITARELLKSLDG